MDFILKEGFGDSTPCWEKITRLGWERRRGIQLVQHPLLLLFLDEPPPESPNLLLPSSGRKILELSAEVGLGGPTIRYCSFFFHFASLEYGKRIGSIKVSKQGTSTCYSLLLALKKISIDSVTLSDIFRLTEEMVAVPEAALKPTSMIHDCLLNGCDKFLSFSYLFPL